MFNIEKAHMILDEIVVNGEIIEVRLALNMNPADPAPLTNTLETRLYLQSSQRRVGWLILPQPCATLFFPCAAAPHECSLIHCPVAEFRDFFSEICGAIAKARNFDEICGSGGETPQPFTQVPCKQTTAPM